MKKLALILALVMIAAFSVPAFAGEFSLNGTYRLTATNTDPGVAPVNSNFQQRFRLPFKWVVNDNIVAYMRTDWTETNYWGNGNMGTGDMVIDYAWVRITQPVWNLTVGEQEVLLGNWSAFDSDQEGFTLGLDFSPVTVTLAYGKLSENGAKTDTGTTADANSYGAEVKYAAETFTVGALFAMAVDEGANAGVYDDTKIGYGIFANVNMGAVSFKGEIDFFDGEASATVDYAGMNIWGDLAFKASDALTVGIAGYYAEGNNKATETQLSSVSSTGFSYQINDYDFNSALMIDEAPTLSGDNFDMAVDAGIQEIKGYLRFQATEEIKLFASLAYATPDDTSVTNLDSRMYAFASVDYAWMPNVTLSAGAAYINPDYDDTTNDDPTIQYVGRLGINF
jgi:hypothetical protein